MLPPTAGGARPPPSAAGPSPVGPPQTKGPSASASVLKPPAAAGPSFKTETRPKSDTSTEGGLGNDLTIVVSRLLDMPVEKTVFGATKGFRVRVFDEADNELQCTEELEPGDGKEADSITVPPEDGTMQVRTRSKLIFLQVEHVGGITGNRAIGRCQIHRYDPRSSQVWPYALSSSSGTGANCGIELKLVEKTPIPLTATQMGTSQPRTSGGASGSQAPPLVPPGSFRQLSLSLSEDRPSLAGMQDMNHGVSALLEFEKVTDLPYPSDDSMDQLMITVLEEERGRELLRVGPFVAKDKGGNRGLVTADCRGSRIFVHAPLHFGGDAEEGAMFIQVGIWYVRSGGSGTEPVGITDPIKVSWRPTTKLYYEVRPKGSRKVLGGVYLAHRLATEAEVVGQTIRANDATAAGGSKTPKIGAPLEVHSRVSGRTRNFPPGSVEEAFEHAALNAEAQNRALLQRCKIADPESHDEASTHVRTVNGYREWDSLDSLFASMGPNPLAFSEELGPAVTRAYNEQTTVLQELVHKLPPANTPAEQQLNLKLINMMYREDPAKVQASLRPVVCKDPDEVAATKDMRWCPDPPVYAPLRSMHGQDKETLRLACYDPRQSAKLLFADVNPNYRINEDVWGILADGKASRSLLMPKPDARHHRVKDDCIMA